ncbi:GNAT family N-acetyltransferase [uncultured Akkermansia sp.]|uniref:GNAT family N-acetyltransferase n=1 Tax=uncultured Akkermansia sp. TaxID=512294 RepID=UPI002626398F|nr:GNAT family N-acetyltransferase [uncultured Akkermansia sp.]
MIQRTTWATSIDKANSIAASNSRNLNILLGLLGAGALATGAVATAKYLTRKDPKSEMGKIKLKLPGSRKDPNTAAEVELPIDMPGMSPTLIEGLNRGVRLQARKNVRANSFKRDPQTGKLVPYEEWKAQQQVNKPTEPQTSDNVIEFPALAKAASTSPGLANLLAKSLGAGVGGTIGALGGGAGAAHLAKHLGAGDTAAALSGILGMGAGGLGGVLIGSSAANAVVPPAVTEGDPKAEVQASYANTGSSPAGYTADPDEDFSDDDLDKYASAPPQQGPPRPANQLARRPVTNTLPPSPGLAPAASKAGTPPTGNLDDLSIKLQGTANDALDMQAKQAYVVDYIAFPADGTKQAYDLSGRMEAQAIMDRIYNEDPSYWPYGLGIPGHDGVYLIRDKMTKQAAGFVGWQQMMEGGRLIGSYSIGILPEFRGHGFAKEAVAKILREKAAGVDEVRSYVMPHNQKSKALAASLGVPVHEEF